MIFLYKEVKYHEFKTRIIIAKENCKISIGVPSTRIKEKNDGFNHDDLGYGALLNFLSWPPYETKTLASGDALEILPFTPYNISGDYEFLDSENIDDEIIIFIP